MRYERFIPPAILLILTIIMNRIGVYMVFSDGSQETTATLGLTSIFFQLCSVVLFFVTLIVFAYSLGKSPERAEVRINEKSKEANWWAIEKPENNIDKNDGDKARIVGFSSIALSGFAILLMIVFGFISILSSLGPGLGFSGGTCDSFCERTWLAALFSGKLSIYLFFIGLISLARPWSWIPESWISQVFSDKEE
ncbi:MAG: hypothetical protein CMB08_06825 [Euryarchaeota archaeon]|nr:hypothetical protein [Euryarchaeota archaeon]